MSDDNDLAIRGPPPHPQQLQFGVDHETMEYMLRCKKLAPCSVSADCSLCRSSECLAAHGERRLHYQLRQKYISEFHTYRHKISAQSGTGKEPYPNLSKDPTEMISGVTKNIGKKWQLSILMMEKHGQHFPFMHVALFLLGPFVPETLATTYSTLYNFVIKLCAAYLNVVYHNSTHAAIVAHLFSVLRRIFRQQVPTSAVNELSCVIAALGHDAGHFGRSNMFCSETNDPLSILFNNTSILENYHSFITISILMESDSNILQSLDRPEFGSCRKHIAELILATDMTSHFTIISHFASLKPLESAIEREKWEWCLARLMMKLADIGHAALDWDDHYSLSVRIAWEFYQQGDEERHLNIPVTPLCDRSRHVMFYSDQRGFLQFVVLPLVYSIKGAAEKEPASRVSNVILSRINANKAKWSELGKRRVEVLENKCKQKVRITDLDDKGRQRVEVAQVLLSTDSENSEEPNIKNTRNTSTEPI